ncbi:hypothetical protein R3P38DRAFT_2800399 [Favolaschia claudopus]|uniref:Uncharacterized protein n=1 Tax=Favolaschia claudopus TaxID=2862362 RepID=A0AAV9ZY99_9AGAR
MGAGFDDAVMGCAELRVSDLKTWPPRGRRPSGMGRTSMRQRRRQGEMPGGEDVFDGPDDLHPSSPVCDATDPAVDHKNDENSILGNDVVLEMIEITPPGEGPRRFRRPGAVVATRSTASGWAPRNDEREDEDAGAGAGGRKPSEKGRTSVTVRKRPVGGVWTVHAGGEGDMHVRWPGGGHAPLGEQEDELLNLIPRVQSRFILSNSLSIFYVITFVWSSCE